MDSPTIRLSGVTKRFGAFTAVSALDLTVRPGRIYGFLGPNGAGKTTTIRMIMDIIAPDEGVIELFGAPRSERTNERIGYLPEERGLYKKMTVRAALEYFARLKGLPSGPALRARIDEWLERFALTRWRKEKIEAMSKGMGQKVQFIATMLHEPELVILDEPFSGLDPVNTELLTSIILDLKTRGRTVVFSTHVMEQAEKLCDEVFLIAGGQKVLDGPLGEIKRQYGRGSYLVRVAGGGALPEALPGVERALPPAADHPDGPWEVFLAPGATGNDFLTALAARAPVRGFEQNEPSLHDIFIQVVGRDVFQEAAIKAAEARTNA